MQHPIISVFSAKHISCRKQFVQIDEKQSELVDVKFGVHVPQGSILRPALFNIYINNLQAQI